MQKVINWIGFCFYIPCESILDLRTRRNGSSPIAIRRIVADVVVVILLQRSSSSRNNTSSE